MLLDPHTHYPSEASKRVNSAVKIEVKVKRQCGVHCRGAKGAMTNCRSMVASLLQGLNREIFGSDQTSNYINRRYTNWTFLNMTSIDELFKVRAKPSGSNILFN